MTLFVKRKSDKAYVIIKRARGYEKIVHYMDCYTKDKNGDIKEVICSHHIVGIAGINTACDYHLIDNLYLRFTKIHYLYISDNGDVRACVNFMILEGE